MLRLLGFMATFNQEQLRLGWAPQAIPGSTILGKVGGLAGRLETRVSFSNLRKTLRVSFYQLNGEPDRGRRRAIQESCRDSMELAALLLQICRLPLQTAHS